MLAHAAEFHFKHLAVTHAKLNQVGQNVRKTQSISLILTSPPPFVFYAAIKGGEESSETDLCPRSAAISVRSEIGLISKQRSCIVHSCVRTKTPQAAA